MTRGLTVLLFAYALAAPILAEAFSLPGHASQNVIHWARHIKACADVSRASAASGNQISMPMDWEADAEVNQIMNGKVAGNPFGVGGNLQSIVQQGSKQRMTQQSFSKFIASPAEWVGTPQEWLNMTTYFESAFMGFKINGNKYAYSMAGAGFHDMFAWLPAAKYSGKANFKDQLLDRWFLNSSTFSFELLVNSMHQPVHFWQNSSTVYAGQSMNYSMEYVFSNFYPNKTRDDLWADFNKTQYLKPMVCADPPTASDPINTTMYIFHPADEFNISGQDLGDATGDTVFVCLDVITNQSAMTDHDYAWLTEWEVELVPRWGQYQNCNGYNPPQCKSEEHFWVGHDAAYYLEKDSSVIDSQCGSNPLVGEWFSLPVGGECKDGARPGDGSCTWRKRRVKTIDGQCLIHGHGFKETCVKEQRAPFPRAKQAFLKAFASDDPAVGGCPEIVTPPLSNSAIIV